MDLLIHGVFDAQTLKTVQQLNCQRIGFDLRAKSLNLVPFHVLKTLIPLFTWHKNYLIFENDKDSTVASFLSLLGEDKNKFELEFRDSLPVTFYDSFDHPFSWFFHPEGDWQNILRSPRLKAIILPVKYQGLYKNMPKLWDVVGQRNLQVILHADSFKELELYVREKNLTLSVDLGNEMEMGFRQIDHSRLFNLRLWRMNNEITIGQ